MQLYHLSGFHTHALMCINSLSVRQQLMHKRAWYRYTMECYSAIERSAPESFVETWVGLEPVTQSEVDESKYTNTCVSPP